MQRNFCLARQRWTSQTTGVSKLVSAFTKNLAWKWAMHNIQLNAIAPGRFPTHMSDSRADHYGDLFLDKIPLRRFADDHLEDAAVFLVTHASDCVTGHVLVVDAGQAAC